MTLTSDFDFFKVFTGSADVKYFDAFSVATVQVAACWVERDRICIVEFILLK